MKDTVNRPEGRTTFGEIILHGCVFAIYGILYLIIFMKLEERNEAVHYIHSKIDDVIPFCEYFIVPYLIWFGFIAFFLIYYLFTDLTEYYRLGIFLAAGMTVFLIVSAVYPNGLYLRPDLESLGRDNVFIRLVAHLYDTDTPTNVFPSIHVYNSVGIIMSVSNSYKNKNSKLLSKKWFRISTYIIACSIVLSTMFLKQHSIIDVVGGISMSYFFYLCFYRSNFRDVILGLGIYTRKPVLAEEKQGAD